MSILSNRIDSLCKERNITGYRLCKDIGISPNIMTELRSGRRSGISAKNANKIAEYFGVSVGYLLGTEEKENTPTPSEDDAGVLTKEELSRISAAMAEMNEEGRERAVEMVEDLAAGGRFKKHCEDAMDKEA